MLESQITQSLALKSLRASDQDAADIQRRERPKMSIDMSARAVTMRQRRASQLRRLCLALAKAKVSSSSGEMKSKAEESESPAAPECRQDSGPGNLIGTKDALGGHRLLVHLSELHRKNSQRP